MKLISLNLWGGRVGRETVLDYFAAHKDVDIFCLQEVLNGPYPQLDGELVGGMALDNSKIFTRAFAEIAQVLDTHTGYFRPNFLENYGIAIFIKKSIQVVSEKDIFVHLERGFIPTGDPGHHARNMQIVTIDTDKGARSILNFHGLWNGKGKGDSAERIAQSEKIVRLCKGLDHPFVLCGDFNLLPDTQSIKLLEELEIRNLIRDYDIKSTRTSLYTKPDPFADYVFISPELTVNEFRVLPDEVSDHSPLLLDFE